MIYDNASRGHREVIDILKVPGIVEMNQVRANLRFGADRFDVPTNRFTKSRELTVMKKFKSIDQKIVMLTQRNGGPPALPALRAFAADDPVVTTGTGTVEIGKMLGGFVRPRPAP